MGTYLDRIKSPGDLKKLNIEELNSLCGEIRSFLIDSVSETGGHLASNLGVVELTAALHTVFDMPEDKIVFDVGHQSYVHKIITGRADRFNTLRKFGGLSGFPKRSESEYDSFNTGHSSTSISAALGIARARDLKGENFNVIALFGDGALTGGMMYEAMNDAGHSAAPLILVLNDNNMSIDKNVGSITHHLRRLRISPQYFKSKKAVENALKKLPFLGDKTAAVLRKIKRKIRRRILQTTMFEDLGFIYIGPVDGHDLKSLIACLEYAKKEKKPVLVHVLTKKGKGYYHAEADASKFHGVGPFNIITGATKKSSETYSMHFGKTLVRLAEKNEKIAAVTAAMPSGTGLNEFAKRFKDRFFDVGIAEAHGVTMSAGLAVGGMIPVIPLYSSFLQRAYDQVLHDVCLQNLHVVFPIDRAGIVGADGETHQGIYDISYLSHMPNMTVLSPANFKQLDEMLDYAINVHNGPIAIRYPRGCEELKAELLPFDINRAEILRSGKDVTIIAAGRMAVRALEAADELENKGICAEVILLPAIKPPDVGTILKSAQKTGFVVTVEDNVKTGGMGEMIAVLTAENNIGCAVKIFAFPDKPIVQGSIAELEKKYGLDTETIVKEVVNGKSKT